MRQFPPQHNLTESDVLYFSHIPKTAGMTFRTIVEDYFSVEEICPATLNAQLAKIPFEELQKYRLLRGHLGFINIPELIPGKNIVNVTFLREPVARVISHYEYIRRMPGDPHYEAVKDMTLEEFAQKLTAGKVRKNIQTYHIAKTHRFKLDGLSPTEILELAKESLDRFAFVGLVERFQDSLFLLSYIFGWKPIINTRKENAAKAKKSLEEIPASTLEVIKENTQLDQALYQDAKEIFEIRFSEMLRTLVEKYGTPDELKSFDPQQPIATERLFTLLDKHYQQRYIESHNITANSYTYDFSQSLRGAGWQRREYPKDIPIYRWTGPSTASTLDLPVRVDKDTDFVIELRLICIQVVPLDILDSLWLEVNGHPVKLHILLSDQGTQFRQGFIPAKVLDPNHPLIECTFRVNRVSPLNANNPRDPDKRQVGVAFTFVQAFPANVLRQCSTLAPFFKCPKWIEAIDFLREQMKPEETLASSIVFKSQLPATEICEYDSFLTKGEAQWLILHKGKDVFLGSVPVGLILFKLMMRGFSPVFANEVFVIFSTRKDLPPLRYTSQHVKPLYVDYLKQSIKTPLKFIHHEYLKAKAEKTSPSQLNR